jgi:hypothetical protein
LTFIERSKHARAARVGDNGLTVGSHRSREYFILPARVERLSERIVSVRRPSQ